MSESPRQQRERLLRLSANCGELDAAAIRAVLEERSEFIEALEGVAVIPYCWCAYFICDSNSSALGIIYTHTPTCERARAAIERAEAP